MTRSYKNFPKTRPRTPINIRSRPTNIGRDDPEYRQRIEKTKKQRLNKQLEREAEYEIRNYDKED